MGCTNPVKVTLSPKSPVHIPTAINAGFSAILLAIFAYLHRNNSRIIQGTPATVPTAPPQRL